ncbi:MAG TPA: DegT/DnrJ/EryC1/StrS family aminotransferase [Cyclobacteriaceae bacterium]|nr:DegT/DnrJ/EryC1/StrS family aminotransferase [Cyclobacteriaceae bacterium]
MSNVVPFFSLQPQLKSVEKQLNSAMKAVMSSSGFILGKSLEAFEKDFAAYTGVKWCAGTGNGHDAIYLSLRALEIGRGDEVIVPSNTFIATWLAVSLTGARVVPVESDIQTYNIDPSLVASAITSRTKCIIPVHLYGQACDMTTLMKVARRAGVYIVEDNAQAHGATHNDIRTGSFGIINATSFYPIKNLGALGDGGAITTDSRPLLKKIVSLRNYGSEKKHIASERGINSRLDELQAAVLRVKLKRLDAWNRERISIAKFYRRELRGVGDLVLPAVQSNSTHVYHQFVVRTSRRDQLKSFLASRGVETMIHYPVPPHLQKAYQDHGFKKGQFPLTEDISRTCLSLPVWPGITQGSLKRVTDSITKYFR